MAFKAIEGDGEHEVADCCHAEGGGKGTRIVEVLGNEEQRICWSGCGCHTRNRDVEQIEVTQEGQGAVAALRPAIDEEFTWGDVLFFSVPEAKYILLNFICRLIYRF